MRPKSVLIISIVLSAGIALWAAVSGHQTTSDVDVTAEITRLKADVSTLQKDNDRLRHEVDLLGGTGKASDARLAKAAREQLGYSRPDEVILFVEPVPSVPSR